MSNEPPDPVQILRDLLSEWDDRLAEQERLADEATDSTEARRHRGRAEALRQGIRRLENKDFEDDPFLSAGAVWGRLHDRTQELDRLIAERAPLEAKHRAIRGEFQDMMTELNDVRARLDEILDDDELPDPTDWDWVDEDVRERVLASWGYTE